ncbi:MAG: DUF3179 domain-containing (seleno)protein [Pseudomonadota bacterium]
MARRFCFYLFLLMASFGLAQHLQAQQALPDYVISAYGNPPSVPVGPFSDEVERNVRQAFLGTIAPVGSVSRSTWGAAQSEALAELAAAQDPRIAWFIADQMRFTWQSELREELSAAAGQMLGKTWQTRDQWSELTDHLIAWDIPAPPNYLLIKRSLFTSYLDGWDALFVEGDIDWRLVSWGGVQIDARPYDTTDTPCNCIPAADNPTVTTAEEAAWLRDDDIVFGIAVNGAYRAYPRQIMEVREMVNDTLGGRHLGIPYCTLCGAAQAYFTDELPPGIERPILRTSGLLIRSNKVMYDLTTMSVFDTFLGRAVTGPLAEKGLVLEQASVITTDWGTWKATYPQTTVLTEDLALGRNFDFRSGRDADGPIFPVGDVDPRLPIQEDVLGVVTASGRPVAFPRGAALLALRSGQEVAFENVRLRLDAGGMRAVDVDGSDLGSHQAFWFAWSQFYPDTALWTG